MSKKNKAFNNENAGYKNYNEDSGRALPVTNTSTPMPQVKPPKTSNANNAQSKNSNKK